MNIGLVQMNSRSDKAENLKTAGQLIARLAGQGAKLIVLPEFFNFIGPEKLWPDNAEEVENSPTLDTMAGLAEKFKIHLHIGSLMEKEGDALYNTGIVLDPAGAQIARYRKLHLFDVEIPGGRRYKESDNITPGNEVVSFTVEDIVFGMATCYDLRFPELFRRLSSDGAQVFLLPAAFTLMTGKDHWQLLLQARAVENLCWVAAAGQYGRCPPNHLSYGRSMVVDPWGTVMTQASDGVGTLMARLDMNLQADIRQKFPVLAHRRDDLFPSK